MGKVNVNAKIKFELPINCAIGVLMYEAEYAMDPKNKAFAGVGSPRNSLLWRTSILNFASRNADSAGMISGLISIMS